MEVIKDRSTKIEMLLDFWQELRRPESIDSNDTSVRKAAEQYLGLDQGILFLTSSNRKAHAIIDTYDYNSDKENSPIYILAIWTGEKGAGNSAKLIDEIRAELGATKFAAFPENVKSIRFFEKYDAEIVDGVYYYIELK